MPCVTANAGSSWNGSREMLARRPVRSDGHVGVASVRIARARWRHLGGRTRRGERSAASGSTISHGRRNDARASRFARSCPRTSSRRERVMKTARVMTMHGPFPDGNAPKGVRRGLEC